LKKKTIGIIQPHYLPWIGYFNLILKSDIFVYLDDVEFTRGEWKNRNQIRKNPLSDEPKWISVPIEKKSHFSLMSDCLIDEESDWREKHINSIYESYKKAPFFSKYFENIKIILLNKKLRILSDLNIELIEYICKELMIFTKKIRSSEINCDGNKHTKPLNICKKLGCNQYLATKKSSEYIKISDYNENNIKVIFQNFNNLDYEQFSDKIKLKNLKFLSIIDLLFNQGLKSRKNIE